ncbi:MAG TPA: translesion error-prone DNA polymerase V autoproteolytic subunit [Candidatus Sumerlaeota bacterium]|nr:translesion error-prone DNA polymerase V autoproteolytic subunit [Candidatus Sumerlaeota bacterium]
MQDREEKPTRVTEVFGFENTIRRELPLFLANVPAGFPSPADDYVDRKLDLNEHLVRHPAATFFVRVEGESMTGAGIHSGDILIVDRALEPADRKIVIAVVNGELTVKRIRMINGALYLAAENPRYEPIRINGEDEDFKIWGVVIWVLHEVV